MTILIEPLNVCEFCKPAVAQFLLQNTYAKKAWNKKCLQFASQISAYICNFKCNE